MSQRFEHCRLVGNEITYLGRDRVFESKRDKAWTEFSAWDHLEKQGWELVSVVIDENGQHVAYLRRPVEDR